MSGVTNAQRRLRDRSRALFGGAQYRLEVGAAIADGDGLVCIKDLATLLGDPPGTGSVNTELKVLERSGLLTRAPQRSSDRKVYLVRQPSPFWDLCTQMRASAYGHKRSRVGRRG
jgi:hypothetical protein